MHSPKSYIDAADPTGLQTLEIISHATAFNRWMYRTIRPFLQGSILEIGSGIGNISEFLIQDGYTVTLSDYDTTYCARLTERYKGAKGVQDVLRIDLERPDFYAAYAHIQSRYDTIFLLNVIEHINDDQAAIRHCASLLKAGGRLILLAPAFSFLYCGLDKELGHHRRYTKAALARLLIQEGFAPVHQQYFNALGMAGWFFFGKLAGRNQLTAPAFQAFNIMVPFARLLDKLVNRWAGLSVIAVAAKKN